MADLPAGTVTFLFTDIEGSTRLSERFPQAYPASLARHHAIIRQAVEAHSGAVFETIGDAVYAAFPRSSGAVAAALDAQLGLAREPWGEVGEVRVRMGIHAGEVERWGARYSGPPLYRCARLAASAHGGQVVLSLTAAELAREVVPEGAALRPLGEHRLRDLARPEQVFQLLHPALEADFPPLRTLKNRPSNLPAQATPFVGRAHTVDALRHRLLRAPDVRLITLLGPGGTGKTRLALQAALDSLDDFADGVFFVPLAHVSDPELAPSAIARVLDVREVAGRPSLALLKDYLRDKRLLLVLDNFEQMPGAAPVIAELLAACPSLKILATSRAPLGVYGEHEFPVPPLSLPEGGARSAPSAAGLAQYEAARLFVERAQTINPAFALTDDNAPAVAELCHRLDGLPLAIELAAARTRLLSPQAMLARLRSAAGGLPLLHGGAHDRPARQQTLHATMAWSYNLLTPEEQALFRRLAVFAGGWTLDAAERVVAAVRGSPSQGQPLDGPGPRISGVRPDVFEGLHSLAAKSLVLQDARPEAAEPRFLMLETIREFAWERLEESGEVEPLRRRHADYCVTLAEQAEPRLRGAQQAAWFAQLEQEHDNFRTALRWLLDRGECERGLRLAAALWLFWDIRGYLSEGREWLAALLSRSEAAAHTAPAPADVSAGVSAGVPAGTPVAASPTLAHAEVLTGAGVLASHQGDHAAGLALLQAGVAMARRLADRHALGSSLAYLGQVLQERDSEAARQRLQEALVIGRELGDDALVARALSNLGEIARWEGDYERAGALYEESLPPARALGHKWRIAATLHNLGYVALRWGDHEQAGERFRESLRLMQELRTQRGIASCVAGFAGVAAKRGEAERAARLFGAAAAMLAAIGADLDPPDRIEYDHNAAAARAHLGDAAFAAARAAGHSLSPEQAVAYALDR